MKSSIGFSKYMTQMHCIFKHYAIRVQFIKGWDVLASAHLTLMNWTKAYFHDVGKIENTRAR